MFIFHSERWMQDELIVILIPNYKGWLNLIRILFSFNFFRLWRTLFMAQPMEIPARIVFYFTRNDKLVYNG